MINIFIISLEYLCIIHNKYIFKAIEIYDYFFFNLKIIIIKRTEKKAKKLDV